MNSKGFTTTELILTIALVIIIMATIINVTYTYRDKKVYEETLTEVSDYKNNLTKIIYEDILKATDKVVKMTKIDELNYSLITSNGNQIPLIVVLDDNKQAIVYDGITYTIPGAKEGLVSIKKEDIVYKEDIDNNIYALDIVFKHNNIDYTFKIHFAIT